MVATVSRIACAIQAKKSPKGRGKKDIVTTGAVQKNHAQANAMMRKPKNQVVETHKPQDARKKWYLRGEQRKKEKDVRVDDVGYSRQNQFNQRSVE